MPAESQTFVATADNAGMTILGALRQWMPGTSWSAARKLLRDRQIRVNDALCLDEARRIQSGDEVSLSTKALREPPSTADVRIVWLDAEVVVADKPAGMIVLRHASERSWHERKKRVQPALEEALSELITRREGLKIGPRPSRFPVLSVHRIDRDTSGLLVFARNSASQQKLIEQFKIHSVERTYLAVASGQVVEQTFDTFLVEDRGDGLRGSTQEKGIGKRAVTHVRPIEILRDFTFLECRLETGRTHQIRIHLSEAGHPIVGDAKYGGRHASEEMGRSQAFPRLALHAATLGFEHPLSRKRIRFESPLPADFANLLERLKPAK